MKRRRSVKFLYVCLEQSTPGSAAQAHLEGFFPDGSLPGLKIVRARHRPGDHVVKKILFLVFALAQFAFLLPNASSVGARAHPFVLPILLSSKAFRKKSFLFLQGRPDDLPVRRRLDRFLVRISDFSFRRSIAMSELVFTTSDGLAQWSNEIGTGVVKRVTNGVDTSRFSDVRDGRTGVVYVGSSATWQGLEVLMAAFESSAWPVGLGLTVIGVDRDQMPSLSSADVRVLGRLPPHHVARELSSALIGVSPKRLDQATVLGVSPFKLAEYHGAGLAIVASDVPGQREMIERSKGGLLFTAGSPDGLLEAIGRIAADECLAAEYGKAARDYAVRELSWEFQREVVDSALKELVGVMD